MHSRPFVNLILEDSSRLMYSLHRLDAMKHLFYPSAAEALRAAHDAKTRTKKKPSALERLSVLPKPEINFHPMSSCFFDPMSSCFAPSMNRDSFSLLGRDGIVFTDSSGMTALYSIVNGTLATMPRSPRPPYRMNLPMTQANDPADRTEEERGSLYVMDLSIDVRIDDRFQVLACHRGDGWCWRALPAPPFVARYPYDTCYTAVDSSTICISSTQGGFGTYAFDTARHAWRQVGKWALPWCGKAEYIPELKLWLGLSLPVGSRPLGTFITVCSPPPPPFPRLCALDLSAMDAAEQPPTPQGTWDFLDLPEDNKRRWMSEIHLVNLGSGMFCIATHLKDMVRLPRVYDDPWTDDEDGSPCTSNEDDGMMDVLGDEIVILTGVKVERCCDDGEARLQMIKHKSRRYDLKEHTMKSVL